MRILYTYLFYFCLPFIFLRLYWRGIKAPQYRLRWSERLAYYHTAAEKQCVWVHAVSVGEFEAVLPVLKQLLAKFPQHQFLVTTTTPTGSARVAANLGDGVKHVYLPYDVPSAIRRFFKQFNPQVAIFVETEIWPNIFKHCAQQDVPLYIINARLSEKSLRGYQRIAAFAHATLQNVTLCAAQTEADALRFQALGVEAQKSKVLGNIKFDAPIADVVIAQGKALREQLFAERFVWLIASTHKGEEVYFLQRYQELKQIAPDLLLVFAPRHPERSAEVKALCLSLGLSVRVRTEQATAASVTEDVYLLDTLGELKMFYAAADLAFVGGSLVPVGGHNILEPAAVSVPIMFGPYMTNFKAIAQGIMAVNGALQCAGEQEIESNFERLYTDAGLRGELVNNASKFISSNRGALQRVLQELQVAIERLEKNYRNLDCVGSA